MEKQNPISWAGLLTGLGLLGLAIAIAIDASAMQVPPLYAKVGPRVFSYLVAFALAVSGCFFFWQSAIRRSGFPAAEGKSDWFAVCVALGAMVVHLNILKPLGFVIAGIFLFLAVSLAFGSRRVVRDGIIAIAMVLTTYLIFTRFLGLQLPPGLLKGLI